MPGPLTDEIEKIENDQLEEKKKAKRDAKKEKLAKKKATEAEKRKEDEAKRKDREEKERFLHLSDREKVKIDGPPGELFLQTVPFLTVCTGC